MSTTKDFVNVTLDSACLTFVYTATSVIGDLIIIITSLKRQRASSKPCLAYGFTLVIALYISVLESFFVS